MRNFNQVTLHRLKILFCVVDRVQFIPRVCFVGLTYIFKRPLSQCEVS